VIASLPAEQLWNVARRNPRPFHSAGMDAWVVHRPEHVDEAASLPGIFSSSVDGPRDKTLDFLLTVDPPRHGADRALVLELLAGPLRRARRNALSFAASAAASLPARQSVDLVADFAQPLAAHVACDLLGLPASAHRPLLDLVRTLVSAAAPESPPAPSAWTIPELVATSPVLVGLSNALARSVDRGQAMAEGFAAAVAVAAVDTTSAMLALSLRAALYAPLVSPDGHLPPALLETPLLGLYRQLLSPAILGGVELRSGERVLLAWALAQRHLEARGAPGSYLFGRGDHTCPARSLAWTVVSAGLSAAAARVRVMDIGAAPTPLRDTPYHFQALSSLPAVTT